MSIRGIYNSTCTSEEVQGMTTFIGRRQTTENEEGGHHKRFCIICNMLMARPLIRVHGNLISGSKNFVEAITTFFATSTQ